MTEKVRGSTSVALNAGNGYSVVQMKLPTSGGNSYKNFIYAGNGYCAESWDDDWSDETREVKSSPSRRQVRNGSANGHKSKSPNKDG